MEMHIGHKLKNIADNKDIRAARIAEMIGKSEAQVYRIFQSQNISTEVLGSILQVLDMGFGDFFKGDTRDRPGPMGFGKPSAGQSVASEATPEFKAEMEDLKYKLNLCHTEKNHLEQQVKLQSQTIQMQEQFISSLQARG
ncbi:helix-turn-helix domain-containing protein [Rufibacter soli]